MEAKIVPLEKKDKKTNGINRDERSQKNTCYILFNHKRNDEILEELKAEPVNRI
jgi:hypothetical protein